MEIDNSAIDRGEIPARTIRQLVSAVRQNTSSAATELSSAMLLLADGNVDGAVKCLEKVRENLTTADQKMNLSLVSAELRGEER